MIGGGLEIHGWVPAGPLTATDMTRIDLEMPFEISDGKLEMLIPPSPWHQVMTRRLDRILAQRYPGTLAQVPLAVGGSGRCPDVLALRLAVAEVLYRDIRIILPDLVEVVVEVISHDKEPGRDAISVRRDREVKFGEYAAAGIPEYWIVDEDPTDPEDALVEIYHLCDGQYTQVLTTYLSGLSAGALAPPPR